MARSMAASMPSTHWGPARQGASSQRREPLQPNRGWPVSPMLPVLPMSNVPQLWQHQQERRKQQGWSVSGRLCYADTVPNGSSR